MDRMDSIIAAAVRQGFTVGQSRRGTWFFRKGIATLTFVHPRTANDWLVMLNTLRGAGLEYPD